MKGTQAAAPTLGASPGGGAEKMPAYAAIHMIEPRDH